MNEYQEFPPYKNNVFGVLAGLVIGSVAGALTMLLLAPQSGEETRSRIRDKSIELRDRTTGIVEDALAQVRSDKARITMNGRQKAKELVQQGQALVVEQLDRVSEAALAGKKAIQSS